MPSQLQQAVDNLIDGFPRTFMEGIPDQELGPNDAVLSQASLPGGANPPSTWNHWLAGVGKQCAPTIAMAQVGAAYITAAAQAKAGSGRAWNFCFHVSTTIPKVR